MITVTEQIRAERAAILARKDTDPILSYNFMAADADVSLATFKRSILPRLEAAGAIVEITDNRRGALRSKWDEFKASCTRKRQSAPAAA
jgi:hypothetical protein